MNLAKYKPYLMYLKHPAVACVLVLFLLTSFYYAVTSTGHTDSDYERTALNICQSQHLGNYVTTNWQVRAYECWNSKGQILAKLDYRFVKVNLK